MLKILLVAASVLFHAGNAIAAMSDEDYDWIKRLANDSTSSAAGLGSACQHGEEHSCDNSWTESLAAETQGTLHTNLLDANKRYQNDVDKVEIQLDPSTAHPHQVSNLFVFISFSIPDKSLKPLAAQVANAGGYLVLRGLVDNNVIKTNQQILDVIGEEHAERVLIDPMMFRQFAINSVPAFVVVGEEAKQCTEKHCETPKHDMVYGNMPLESALLLLAQSGDYPGLAKELHKRVVR